MAPTIQCPAIDGYQIVQHPSGACIATPDWMWIAAQTGRLDFVTALLAILGIMLGLFALFSFTYVSGKSAEIARKAAEEVAREEAPRAVDAALPSQLSEALAFHIEAAISSFDPDKLAGAVEETKREKRDDDNGPG